MAEIKILIYTDSPDVNEDPKDTGEGVATLIRLRDKWKPAFADIIRPRVVNRFENPETPQKLTRDFLKDFNEIWFFGLRPVPSGGQEHELYETERAELERWMKDGEEEG